MIYGIASYKRPECRTVKTLVDAGVKKEDIVISVQSEADYQQYQKIHPDIKIIYNEADSASGNRNNLLKHIKQRPLCLIDDDIVSFSLYKNGFKVDTKKSLEFINQACKMIKANCSLVGIAPNNNGIIAKQRQSLSTDVLLQGSFLIVFGNNTFDESFKMVEDYEISLSAICNGSHTLRLNHVVANKPKNGTNEGGLHERYVNGELPYWLNRLSEKYPIFKPNKTMTGGQIKWT